MDGRLTFSNFSDVMWTESKTKSEITRSGILLAPAEQV